MCSRRAFKQDPTCLCSTLQKKRTLSEMRIFTRILFKIVICQNWRNWLPASLRHARKLSQGCKPNISCTEVTHLGLLQYIPIVVKKSFPTSPHSPIHIQKNTLAKFSGSERNLDFHPYTVLFDGHFLALGTDFVQSGSSGVSKEWRGMRALSKPKMGSFLVSEPPFSRYVLTSLALAQLSARV